MGKKSKHNPPAGVLKVSDSKKRKTTSTEQDEDLATFGTYLSTLPATSDDKETFLRNFMVQQQWKTGDDADEEEEDDDDGSGDEGTDSRAAEELRAAQREFEMNREEEMRYNLRYEKGAQPSEVKEKGTKSIEEKESVVKPIEEKDKDTKETEEDPENATKTKETKQEKRKRKKKEKAANKIAEAGAQQTANKEDQKLKEAKVKPKAKKQKANKKGSDPKTSDPSVLLRQLREHATDISEDQLNAMLDNDFDPAEFDKQMDAIFNQKYYEQAESTHPFLNEDFGADDDDDNEDD